MRRIRILIILSLTIITSCGRSSGTARLIPDHFKPVKNAEVIYFKTTDNSAILLFDPKKEKIICRYSIRLGSIYRILDDPSDGGLYASLFGADGKLSLVYIERKTGECLPIEGFDLYSGWFGLDISSSSIYIAGKDRGSADLYAKPVSMPEKRIGEAIVIPDLWNSKYLMIESGAGLVMSLSYNDTGSQLYFPETKTGINLVRDYFGSNDSSSIYFLEEDLLNANFLFNNETDEKNLYKLYRIDKLCQDIKGIKLSLIYSMSDPYNFIFTTKDSYIVFSKKPTELRL